MVDFDRQLGIVSLSATARAIKHFARNLTLAVFAFGASSIQPQPPARSANWSSSATASRTSATSRPRSAFIPATAITMADSRTALCSSRPSRPAWAWVLPSAAPAAEITSLTAARRPPAPAASKVFSFATSTSKSPLSAANDRSQRIVSDFCRRERSPRLERRQYARHESGDRHESADRRRREKLPRAQSAAARLDAAIQRHSAQCHDRSTPAPKTSTRRWRRCSTA